MTFVVPRRLGFFVLVLGFLPALARAEPTPSSPTARAWTDPPARAAAEAKPTPAPEASKQTAAAPAPAETKRPARIAARPAKTRHAHTEARARVVRPAAATPHRQAVRMVARAPDRAVRHGTWRPTPYAARPPVIRYSYGIAPESTGAFVYEDDRARRIRQAQEAGYLVVRSRSVEFPDGRRLRTYRPYEEESDD